MNDLYVVKRDGTRELFDANQVNLALVEASEGLTDQISKVVQVATELQIVLFDVSGSADVLTRKTKDDKI